MKTIIGIALAATLFATSALADSVTPYAGAPDFLVIGTELDRSSVIWSDGCGDRNSCHMTVGEKTNVRILRGGYDRKPDKNEKTYSCKLTSKHTRKDGLALTSVCGWSK